MTQFQRRIISGIDYIDWLDQRMIYNVLHDSYILYVSIVQSRWVSTFFCSAIVTTLERHLNDDRMLEDVFRAIKPRGTRATPTIGRATMLQVVTKVSRIRGIRPRLPARNEWITGFSSRNSIWRNGLKYTALIHSACATFSRPLLSIYVAARVTFRLFEKTRMRMNGSPYNSE